MSLRGPAWPRCVWRGPSSAAHLRRPRIQFSRLAPKWQWLCKSNARWTDLLQAGRDRIAIRQLSRARGLALFFLAMTTSAPESALAKCHIFRVWHYPRPQKCFTALAPFHVKRQEYNGVTLFVLPPERIEIPLPAVLFEAAPEGDEYMHGIAKLHALMDAPHP